jgi:hypothetical protein
MEFLTEVGLGDDDRLYMRLADQWLQYKQKLVQEAGGGGGGR